MVTALASAKRPNYLRRKHDPARFLHAEEFEPRILLSAASLESSNDEHQDQANTPVGLNVRCIDGFETTGDQKLKDDHGNTAASATFIDNDSNTIGFFDATQDSDWFRIDVIAGTKYEFNAIPESASHISLTLFAADGLTSLASDRDGSGYIEWQAIQTGPLFLKVSSTANESCGSYRLISRFLPNSLTSGFASNSNGEQVRPAASAFPSTFLRVDPIAPVFEPYTNDDGIVISSAFDDDFDNNESIEEEPQKRRRRFKFFSLGDLLESVFQKPIGFLTRSSELIPSALPKAIPDNSIHTSSNDPKVEEVEADEADDILKWLESIYLPDEPAEVEAVAPQNQRANVEPIERVLN